MAIIILLAVVVGHSHLCGVVQVVSRRVVVGTRIFSIGVGLGFVAGLIRGSGKRLLIGLARCLLHRLRMLEEVLGQLRS